MQTDRHGIVELEFTADRHPAEHTAGTALEVVMEGPGGAHWPVPGFACGEPGAERSRFGARFRPPAAGEYSYLADWVTASGERRAAGDGGFVVDEAAPGKEWRDRGRLRASADRRYLEWTNGEPFLWLADTWWMAFSSRIDDEGLARLCRDRRDKGFSVVQLVAGLFPDMAPLDARGANGGGTAWQPGFTEINPAYFDEADERIRIIVDNGLVPCIVGCWGYYLTLASEDVMRAHWLHLIARYAAYPVVFCLAGETRMPYYLSATKEADRHAQTEGWTRIARFVRENDPYGNPVTTHPDQRGCEQLTDPSLLDFEMLQTGHGDRSSLPFTVTAVRESRARADMPVIDSEVCYEGIGAACREDLQRYLFWICVLNGACGHTYGANGLWQMNAPGRPYGPSPHGMEWGDTVWTDAMSLPGSAAVGRQKRFLETLPWWTLEPGPDIVTPSATPDQPMAPHAARSSTGDLTVVYCPSYPWGSLGISGFQARADVDITLFDPVRGTVHERPGQKASGDGVVRISGPAPDHDGRAFFPIYQDWLLIARTTRSSP